MDHDPGSTWRGHRRRPICLRQADARIRHAWILWIPICLKRRSWKRDFKIESGKSMLTCRRVRVYFLSSWKLELGATQSFNNMVFVLVLCSARYYRLSDVDTGNSALWLAKSTSHTSLQTIGACARQHLVDADDMVRVHAHTNVKCVLAAIFN